MKRITTLIIALIAALALAGCTTTGELEGVRAQRDVALAIIKENSAAADRAAARRADLAMEREKRLTAEAEAKKTKAHVAYLIADKADAGGKAAIAVTLALAQDAQPPAQDLERVAPPPAPMPVPTITVPKSAWDKGMDVFDRFVGLADRGLKVWSIAKAAQTQVDLMRLQEDGNTARNGQMWGGIRDLSNSTRDVAHDGFVLGGTLGARATTEINVNGNNNNVGGRDATNTIVTNTNNCTSAPGGNGGGTGQAGGGGTNGAGGSNNAGDGAPSGSVPCTAGK